MKRLFRTQTPGGSTPALSGLVTVLLALGRLAAQPVLAEAPDPRQPVPSDSAQQEALQIVRDVYAEEYEAAKTQARKLALAQELIDQAAKTRAEPANHYVLLWVARNLAAQAGDAKTSLRAVSRIAEAFQVDGLQMKSQTLAEVAEDARSTMQKKALAEAGVALIDEAVAADRYELAGRIADSVLPAARSARDKQVRASLESRRKRIETLAKANDEYQKALVVLQANPADAKANLAAGRYLCLAKGDWEKGISMLALGSDEKLSALAQRELKGPAEPEDGLALADGWWELSETSKDEAKKQLQIRAATWYRYVLPELAGLPKVKAQKRLADCPYSVPIMVTPGKVISPERLYGDKKILLIFKYQDELDVAKKACEKYGLKYDTAKEYDMNKEDYSTYHTILSGTNAMDYWQRDRKKPEAFRHLEAFVRGGGHLLVTGSFNCRNTEHLRRFGISTSYYHTSHFRPVPGKTEILLAGNEEIVPKDGKMQSVGNFTVSVPHTVLLERGRGSYEGKPALATLEHQKGRVTFTAVEPRFKKDYWLIRCLLCWVARGCPT